MPTRIMLAVVTSLITPLATNAHAQDTDLIEKIGGEAIRSIDFDLCLPSDAQEYEALGKNAVIMLTTTTAISSELPLRSVFVDVGGVRVPLQRIMRKEVTPVGDRAEQISFYLVPIQLTKRDSQLVADFSGSRTDFGITSFGPGFYSKETPAFVRLDEYDDPIEPDTEALAELLAREYPDHFGG